MEGAALWQHPGTPVTARSKASAQRKDKKQQASAETWESLTYVRTSERCFKVFAPLNVWKRTMMATFRGHKGRKIKAAIHVFS